MEIKEDVLFDADLIASYKGIKGMYPLTAGFNTISPLLKLYQSFILSRPFLRTRKLSYDRISFVKLVKKGGKYVLIVSPKNSLFTFISHFKQEEGLNLCLQYFEAKGIQIVR